MKKAKHKSVDYGFRVGDLIGLKPGNKHSKDLRGITFVLSRIVIDSHGTRLQGIEYTKFDVEFATKFSGFDAGDFRVVSPVTKETLAFAAEHKF